MARTRSTKWSEEKSSKIWDIAKGNPFPDVYESHSISLQILLNLIQKYQKHLSSLSREINTLVEETKEYRLLQSIPGIGKKIAAVIISEIGEIERFSHVKKMVAYAGLDPSVFSSGKFSATTNRITKRGSKQLRRAFSLAVQCGIRLSTNKRLKVFYDKKREEGKPYKVAIIACANMLLHWIYATLTHERVFIDLSEEQV